MKKHSLKAALLAVLFILNTSCAVNAVGFSENYNLSPGLELISKELEMRRCTVKGSEVRFDREDFEETLGRTVEYITVTALPNPAVGVLKFAGTEVLENQSFSAKNLALLRFSPTGYTGSTGFEFSADGESALTALCTVNVLEKENSAPVARTQEFEALSGIGLMKVFDVSDSDGDSVVIEVTEYPENGVLKKVGTGFVYTPSGSFSGSDSFCYRAVDFHGASSESAVVTLNVSKPCADVRYDDMNGHWGYTGAMKMTDLGLMSGVSENGRYCFKPDEVISRGDFLAMAMICAGLEEKVSLGAVTTFADDAEIPSNIRSYASYAASAGIISGYRSGSSAVFESNDGITRAEAASVLANILGKAPRVHEFEFTDAASIPTWARDSFASLVSLGIINGSPNGALEPQRGLTRAEAAQILCNVSDFIDSEEKAAKDSGRDGGILGRIMGIFK